MLGVALLCAALAAPDPASQPPIALVVHGGAGTLKREEMTPERERALRADLVAALRAGYAVLARGGASVDAVEAAVVVLEDSPRFNTGKGAVFNAAGEVEMDASIMEGHTRRAGAVGAVRGIRNPIRAARAVMERSEHVMLVADGAVTFAREAGLAIEQPAYFFVERRWQQLEEEKAKARAKGVGGVRAQPAPRPPGAPPPPKAVARAAPRPDAGGAADGAAFGTVGALALDRAGHLAAATSTGGRTNKLPGRVGDTPILGAGTWADERCAVSGTGHGEWFMRYLVAHEVCARAARPGGSLAAAARAVVDELAALAPDTGGVVALDHRGNHAIPFNTTGMYRGWIGEDGEPQVEFWRE
jgi:beta-aspartyl-peptidase (threonine type)